MSEAVDGFFRRVVTDALNPLLDLVARTLLTTTVPDSLPRLVELWDNSWQILLVTYSLLVLVAGVIVMSHETLQTRHSVKEMVPRLVVGFVAGGLSLWVATKGVQIANAAVASIMGGGVDATSAAEQLRAMVVSSTQSGGLFVLLVGVVLAAMLAALVVSDVVREAVTIVLVAGAPLGLMFHALPQTEAIAYWWWRVYGGCLGIQVAQSLALIAAARVFLAPGGFTIFGPTTSGLVNMLVGLALVYILFRIPFWMLSSARGGGGRSMVGSLARSVIAYRLFGLFAGARASGKGHKLQPRPAASRTVAGERADPPWPSTAPMFAPTAAVVARRLKDAYDAERLRAARRTRLPSQQLRFLQPQPQQPVHDPAVTPAVPVPTTPEFSSAPAPDAPRSRTRRGPRPGTAPRFQSPGGPRRHGAPPPDRPMRVPSVPPQLRFQPAAPEPPQPSPPARTSAPEAPVFRQAQPEPRRGDAYRRTPSVPPPLFRAPQPRREGEKS
ncbi:hypothetical protein [Saccharothrix variisporea]|uniref:TrbL/VirB6 plasmid conjugal transfer protein n=1 Tax=Saccharothrix variisporea TaxID=543527 RepID=A0A495XA80_9PSEU|nr:hypothetical protein [Saccharothrix variisporea]RKT69513.1 hypothetical protein DFJ66_2744 [Saccharothrix variisporea]